MATLGWRPAHVIFPVLVILGFLGLSWYKDFNFARDQVIANIFLSFIPAGMFALLVFLVQLVMAPVRMWQESRPETASLSTEIAAFYFGGEQIKEAIYDAPDDADPDTTFLQEISQWRGKVGEWLLVNDSPASMMMFAASVTIDARIRHRYGYGGKVLSSGKEAGVQHIEEHLRRLGEIMKHHWSAKKTNGRDSR
jgi:hypothetical protein